jgi:hypothetical protein
VHLVDELQVLVVAGVGGGADAERVDRQVALVVARLLLGELVAERGVDVDELVAALDGPASRLAMIGPIDSVIEPGARSCRTA